MTVLWRIGSVPYLNAKPLLWGLDRDPAVRLILRPPAALVPLMERGRLQAALLPSIEAIRLGLVHVPGIAIASPGRTGSVLLHLKKPLRQVRTVALDRNSRTTNALARILLERRYGLHPRYVKHDPDGRRDFRRDPKVDAAVTIGDASFRDWGLPAIDLGAAWRDLTGVPFVFALWALPRRNAALEGRLQSAALEGRRRLKEIVDAEHAGAGLTRAECTQYLTERITYDLGPGERTGLRLFERHARDLGLLDSPAPRR
ncbi:MAG TPA: menaquinone biosynthesis protein [Planctomycetota bacterium]|nr:menaquinone biosynthesis protein [Planctomycetota bacterium]